MREQLGSSTPTPLPPNLSNQKRPTMYVLFNSFGPLPEPSPVPRTRETELVPAIKDTGFTTPLAVRIGAISSIKG